MDPSKMIGEKIDRTLEVRYWYENDFGLLDNRAPIFIDRSRKEEDNWYGEVESRSRKLSQKINHPHFLRCLGNDRSHNVDGSTSGNAIYIMYSETLIEYIDRRNPQIIQQFKVPAINCVDDKKLTYNCISDVYKQFFRDMISFIIYLHDEMDLSLVELELERNLVVQDSIVKFYRLRFNESTTPKSKNEDFKHLAKILEKVIDRQQTATMNKDKNKPSGNKNKRDHMPPDFVHLLNYMSNYHESNDSQVLLKSHLALVRSSERLRMIKDFWGMALTCHHRKEKVNDKAFDAMDRSEWGQDWTRELDGRHPEYGIIKDCFDSSDKSHRSLNKRLINFCRNMAEHINSINVAEYNQHDPFNEHEVECIIMAAYAKQLVAFQKEANRHGVLKFLI